MEEVPKLTNFGPTNPIQILNQLGLFWRFCMCPPNDTFNTNRKFSQLVLGLHSKDRKYTRDKANICNPKVNRGCPLLTANRTSADCAPISLGPSLQYKPLRVYLTGLFNAMMVLYCWNIVYDILGVSCHLCINHSHMDSHIVIHENAPCQIGTCTI